MLYSRYVTSIIKLWRLICNNLEEIRVRTIFSKARRTMFDLKSALTIKSPRSPDSKKSNNLSFDVEKITQIFQVKTRLSYGYGRFTKILKKNLVQVVLIRLNDHRQKSKC